jgi:hypothetical protein
MSNKKIVLPELRFKGSEETDMTLKVELAQDSRHVVEGDRTVILSQSEQYDRERQKSEKYRITTIIRTIWKNLTDVSTDNVEILQEMFFNNDKISGLINDTSANTPSDLLRTQMVGKISSDEIDFIRRDYNGSNDPNTYSWYNGGNGFGSVFSDRINWNLFITYPSEKYVSEGDIEVNLQEGQGAVQFNLNNGLPFKSKDNGSYFELYCPFEHGLTIDDFVEIEGEVYSVDIIGNTKYQSEKRYFGIYKGQLADGLVLDEGEFKRVVEKNNKEESTSEYYVVKHKIIKTHGDFELQKNAFESSIFEDERVIQKFGVDKDTGNPEFEENGKVVTQEHGSTYMSILKDEVDVEGLTDHLERPLTKLYVSKIHTNSMSFFSRQQYGYEPQFGLGNEEDLLNDESYLYDGNDKVVKNLNVGDYILGGIYEYNPYTMLERKVADRYLRLKYNDEYFTIDEGPNYRYTPHFEYEIRVYSDYIEESETSDIYNLPSYAKYFEKENVWKWRDIWSKGYVNPNGLGVDYPFINGCHYINNIENFYIKPDTINGITNNRGEDPRINPFLIDDCE